MNTKLKCLLLDDELPGLTYLKMLCEQLPELEVIKAFNHPEIFLKEATSLEFDLCILDIEMPVMDGLQVAELLNGKPVIFTTAYKEYAAEAFDLNAIDYIRKPVRKERLQQAVRKVLQHIPPKAPKKSFVQLNTDKGRAILHFDQILHIRTSETDSRDKQVLLTDHSTLVLKNISFQKLRKVLPEEKFCQVNKQEMISLSCIQFFSHDEITTTLEAPNGKPLVIHLGDPYRSDFIARIDL